MRGYIKKVISWVAIVTFTLSSAAWASPASTEQSHLRPQSLSTAGVRQELSLVLQGAVETATGIKPSSSSKGLDKLKGLANYDSLEKIFGKGKAFKNSIIAAARKLRLNNEEVIQGMSYEGTDQNQLKDIIRRLTEKRRGPPEKAVAFGGGTALITTIKALRNLGYSVKSIQSSVDDGGSTFTLVYRLVEHFYGRIPSPGDLTASLFKGAASADKLYKLLDDQGRIALLGGALEKLADKGRISVITKDDKTEKIAKKGKDRFKKLLDNNEVSEITVLSVDEKGVYTLKIDEYNEFKNNIAVYDESGSVEDHVKTCEELVKILLRKIYKAAKGKGLGYTEEERERAENKKIGDNFAFFASTVLNIARIVDKNYFDNGIVPREGASIRNLMLIGALDYLGVLKEDKNRDDKWEAAIKTKSDKELFQLALNALAAFVGIEDTQVMLSHYDPATVCAIYEGNVILIKQGKYNGEEIIHALTVKVDPQTKKALVALNDELVPKIEGLKPGESSHFIIGSPLGAMRVEFINEHGIISFKINNSGQCTITESDAGPEITYAIYGDKKEKHIIAQDGTGRVKYKYGKGSYDASVFPNLEEEIKKAEKGEVEKIKNKIKKTNQEIKKAIEKNKKGKTKKGIARRGEDKGIAYYAPLKIAGMDVYVRSRFVAMQTNTTETATFSPLSRVIAFGNTMPNPVMREEQIFEPTKEKIDTQYYYQRDLSQRSEANQEAIDEILSEDTKIIVFGPGSFFTSIIPHLMAKGVIEALAARRLRNDIPIVFVMNPNVDNETAGYDMMGLVRFIEQVVETLTHEKYKFGQIFNTLILSGIDTVKLQNYAQSKGLLEEGKSITAQQCINLLKSDSSLINELNLDYVKFLIDRFLKRAKKVNNRGKKVTAKEYTGDLDDKETKYAWAISDFDFTKVEFSIKNDDDKLLKDKWGKDVSGPITILRYIELKLHELQETLYQKPSPEIRIEKGASSKEAKKSRGPIIYTEEDLNTLRAENPRMVIYEGDSPVGIGMASPREPGADLAPHIGFMQELYDKVIKKVNDGNKNLLDSQAPNTVLKISLNAAIAVVERNNKVIAETLKGLADNGRIEVLDIPTVKGELVFDRWHKKVSKISLSKSIVEKSSDQELAAILVGLVKAKKVFKWVRNAKVAEDAEKAAYEEFLRVVGINPQGTTTTTKSSSAGEAGDTKVGAVKVSTNTEQDEVYRKYQAKNAPEIVEYGVTLVMGLPLNKRLNAKIKQLQAVITKEVERSRGDARAITLTYPSENTHATVTPTIRGTYQPIMSLENTAEALEELTTGEDAVVIPGWDRVSPVKIDIKAMLKAIDETAPYKIRFNKIKINPKGEVLIFGKAVSDKDEASLKELRRRLLYEAYFAGRKEERKSAGVHTMIAAIKNFQQLSPSARKRLAGELNKALKGIEKITMEVNGVTLVHYKHRSLSKIAGKTDFLEFGRYHESWESILMKATENLYGPHITYPDFDRIIARLEVSHGVLAERAQTAQRDEDYYEDDLGLDIEKAVEVVIKFPEDPKAKAVLDEARSLSAEMSGGWDWVEAMDSLGCAYAAIGDIETARQILSAVEPSGGGRGTPTKSHAEWIQEAIDKAVAERGTKFSSAGGGVDGFGRTRKEAVSFYLEHIRYEDHPTFESWLASLKEDDPSDDSDSSDDESDTKSSSSGEDFGIPAITGELETTTASFTSTEMLPSLNSEALTETISTYQKTIEKLKALKTSAETAAAVAEPLEKAKASLGMMSLSKDVAGEIVKTQEVSGTIIINNADIPANQKILLTLLDENNDYLKALQEKLGCKVRLLNQFNPSTDTSANMIAISDTKIDTIPNLRYINIETVTEDMYLPLEQVIVFAKGLLVYNVDKSAATETAISNIYRLLAKRPIQKELLEEFLKPNGMFMLSLPAPTPVDEKYYQDLHKQAMAALIAA